MGPAPGTTAFTVMKRSQTRLRELPAGAHILVCDRDPERYAAAVLEGLELGLRVWLANPDWAPERLVRARQLAQPVAIVGGRIPTISRNSVVPFDPDFNEILGEQGLLMVPTGGSTGGLRYCVHTRETLEASARAYLQFFGESQERTLVLLPLYHVAGLLQVIRAEVSGGSARFFAPAQLLEAFERGESFAGYSLSLVPTLLLRMLSDPEGAAGLAQFARILLGGAGARNDLLEAARDARLPLAPSYGMTETAALVAALTPEQFLRGEPSSGRALPHAKVFIREPSGFPAKAAHPGRIVIKATSLFYGYAPGGPVARSDGFATGDLGWMDEHGYLRVIGRLDRIINSGGEKVDPATVEEALLRTELLDDVYVAGTPHRVWGEAVVAYIVPRGGAPNLAQLRRQARRLLAPYEVPKFWVRLPEIPRNALGKVDRAALPKPTVREES